MIEQFYSNHRKDPNMHDYLKSKVAFHIALIPMGKV